MGNNQPLIDLIVKMNLTSWEMQNKSFADLIEKLSDEQISSECAPGRNTGIYLLGHITSVSDDLFKILGVGQNMFPEYSDMFVNSPDKSGKSFPSILELKSAYHAVTIELNRHFSNFKTEDWLSKHTLVSEEDFIKQPFRNKLNVLINRTIHMSNHFGQMTFLLK